MKAFWVKVWGGIRSWVPTSFLLSLPTLIGVGAWCLLEPDTFWQKAFVLVPCIVFQVIVGTAGAFLIHVGRQFK